MDPHATRLKTCVIIIALGGRGRGLSAAAVNRIMAARKLGGEKQLRRYTHEREKCTTGTSLYLKMSVRSPGLNVLGMSSSSALMQVTFKFSSSQLHSSGHQLPEAEAVQRTKALRTVAHI